jgi:hypothetical protein
MGGARPTLSWRQIEPSALESTPAVSTKPVELTMNEDPVQTREVSWSTMPSSTDCHDAPSELDDDERLFGEAQPAAALLFRGRDLEHAELAQRLPGLRALLVRFAQPGQRQQRRQ